MPSHAVEGRGRGPCRVPLKRWQHWKHHRRVLPLVHICVPQERFTLCPRRNTGPQSLASPRPVAAFYLLFCPLRYNAI